MGTNKPLYCNKCAQKILKEWKGWPKKDVIPLLPRMLNDICEVCGHEDKLHPSSILWFNYHSEFSTGLPDYWLLIVQQQKNKWGHPYYYENDCPKCNARAIISLMNYPNGSSEMFYNCEKCGILDVTESDII